MSAPAYVELQASYVHPQGAKPSRVPGMARPRRKQVVLPPASQGWADLPRPDGYRLADGAYQPPLTEEVGA